MSSSVTVDQTASFLRQLSCVLACQPGRHVSAQMEQALQHLGDMLGLSAVVVHLGDGEGSILRLQWPAAAFVPPAQEEGMADRRRWERIEAGSEDGAWLAVPMRANGVVVGRLGVLAPPAASVHNRGHTQELLLLAANQLAIAYENHRLYEQVEALASRRLVLLRRLMKLYDQCTRHVARELHDEVSQSLVALLVEVDALLVTGSANVPTPPHHLDRLRGQLVSVIEEVNRIVLDLRPTLLENKGLMAALHWYATERLRPAGVRLVLSGGRCAPGLSPAISMALYRIGQEAIANVARHANAATVKLDITCEDGFVVLSVQDDGCGFDVERVLSDLKGMEGVGLMGMQERAMLVDGNLTIAALPGQGTCISVRVPWDCSIRHVQDQASAG